VVDSCWVCDVGLQGGADRRARGAPWADKKIEGRVCDVEIMVRALRKKLPWACIRAFWSLPHEE